jgi:hypothetical protein
MLLLNGVDWLLPETGNEKCGFVLQIAVSLRNACTLYLALFVQALLMTMLDSIGDSTFATTLVLQYNRYCSRDEVGLDTRRSYKVSAPVLLW